MSFTTRVSLVGTAALALASTAFGVGSDNDALAQIAELKQELAQLKAQSGDSWLTEQRAAEVRGIVQDVLADAETRTSLQDSGASAGWNNGFFMASADGNFKLDVGALVQVRWFMNDAGNQNTTWGFDNARTQLNFSGNVVDPSWTYRVRLNTGAGTVADFMYIEKSMDNGLSIRAGQFVTPFMRESLVEDGYQLAVDRGYLDANFGQGFSQGVQFGYGGDAWNLAAFLGNTLGAVNNVGLPAIPGNNSNWALAGRFEYKIAGTWDQFNSNSSARGEEFGAMIGVAGHGQRVHTTVGAATAGDKTWAITADATVVFGGASVAGAFVYANNELAAGTTNPYGANVEGAYFVTDDIEIFGRYEYMTFDAGANDKYSGATLGMNYYLGGQNAKFTVDWSMNLDSFTAPGATANGGYGNRADVLGDDGQWVLRAQLQLMF